MLKHRLITKSLTVADTGEITGIAWGTGPDAAGDVIHPGTFGRVTGPVKMLWQHRQDEPIGTWDMIEEKADGLHVAGRLAIEHSPRAREAHAFLRDGIVDGLSIGFRLEKKAAPRAYGIGRDIRREHGLRLAEISIVTFPSHPGARVTSTKSAADATAIAKALSRFRASIRA
ncbi:HK97 family phage prohead protease [Methylorubrum sp. Q1]|uniref:HK97 family phage prohead protease n=1 Tax=Methylorubrum sp. Q1 TaxID=2562453 RepID=UPI001076B3A5|nr:HK97 family phage prohead protease [Methylorubrum sp. Q1]TFZ55917.1 HK97 family phage prohead protease [Methylorubrum sp. Q1]